MAVSPPVCDFDAPWYDFALRDTDGSVVTLSQVAGSRGTLVMFICNHCPYVRSILDRIIRDAHGLARAQTALAALNEQLEGTGVPRSSLAYNLSWHDWLNLKNLILVSRAVTAAAIARKDSRGAHYRSDFPLTDDLARSAFTRARLQAGDIAIDTEAVQFTRVRPGESLLRT